MPRNAATEAACLSLAPMDYRTEAAAIECGWDGCMCGSCAQDVSAHPFVVAKVETARLAPLHDVMAPSTPQAAAPRSRPTAEIVICEPPQPNL